MSISKISFFLLIDISINSLVIGANFSGYLQKFMCSIYVFSCSFFPKFSSFVNWYLNGLIFGVKFSGYLQELVYKLSKVGQAIEKSDLSAASSVLGQSTNADWVQNVNKAFTKVRYFLVPFNIIVLYGSNLFVHGGESMNWMLMWLISNSISWVQVLKRKLRPMRSILPWSPCFLQVHHI